VEILKEIITLDIYSPVQELNDPLFKKKGIQVFVKRDDLIHPFISGNKWRKLKYTLIQAKALKKDHLVTFGGAYSNHLIATACAAAKFGFRSTGFVRGEEVKNHSLMLCRMFGMNLIFADREGYKDKAELFDHYFSADADSYFINEGGAGEEALKGCSELISELEQSFDHIFCAAGTGTTAAGLLMGIEQTASPASLHAVSSLKNGSFLKDDIGKYNVNTQNLILHCDYHFGGYAKTTSELLNFIKQFASSTGILLDQVYTGKTAYAIYDMIKNDQFQAGSKILLIHTGGLLGLLSQAEKF
jgi:1-aminocyclopropane-1-carboxylate deaminase